MTTNNNGLTLQAIFTLVQGTVLYVLVNENIIGGFASDASTKLYAFSIVAIVACIFIAFTVIAVWQRVRWQLVLSTIGLIIILLFRIGYIVYSSINFRTNLNHPIQIAMLVIYFILQLVGVLVCAALICQQQQNNYTDDRSSIHRALQIIMSVAFGYMIIYYLTDAIAQFYALIVLGYSLISVLTFIPYVLILIVLVISTIVLWTNSRRAQFVAVPILLIIMFLFLIAVGIWLLIVYTSIRIQYGPTVYAAVLVKFLIVMAIHFCTIIASFIYMAIKPRPQPSVVINNSVGFSSNTNALNYYPPMTHQQHHYNNNLQQVTQTSNPQFYKA